MPNPFNQSSFEDSIAERFFQRESDAIVEAITKIVQLAKKRNEPTCKCDNCVGWRRVIEIGFKHVKPE